MKLLRLHISLFLVCLLSGLTLSVAAPQKAASKGNDDAWQPYFFDLGWTVCRPFKEKANKKMEISEDDFIAVYSKLKKPSRKRVPPEQAVAVYLQYVASIYNQAATSVSRFYDRRGSYPITKKFMQKREKEIKDIYSDLIQVYEIELDLNNDGVKNRVWQYYYPYIGGRRIGYIRNHIIDSNNQLDTSFDANTRVSNGQLIELNGTSYLMSLPFVPEALEEFNRGNYIFVLSNGIHDDIRKKEYFNQEMSERPFGFLSIKKLSGFFEDPWGENATKCRFIIKLKSRRVK